MAITLIGTPQKGNANNGGNVTLTFSTAPQADDITLVMVGTVAATPADVSMSTANYERLAFFTGTGNTQPAMGIFWKRQLAGALDTTAVCVNNNGITTDTSAFAYVLRGVDWRKVSDATPTGAGVTSSTNPDPASITTVSNRAWIFVFALSVQATGDATPGTVTGTGLYGNDLQQSGSDTYSHGMAAAQYEKATAGAEAPSAWTTWTTGNWYALTVAIKPQRKLITSVS